MVDFNLEEKMRNGLNFREIFKSLFLYSSSLFIAFYWKSRFDEVVEAYMPAGHNLIEKISIGLLVTVMLVIVCYMLFKDGKNKKVGRKRY